jgi:hypothetical protein
MKTQIICDQCADPVARENVVVVQLHNVMLAKSQTERSFDPRRWMMLEESSRVDEFHLCQECGAQLSLALHFARKQILVMITKKEDPS